MALSHATRGNSGKPRLSPLLQHRECVARRRAQACRACAPRAMVWHSGGRTDACHWCVGWAVGPRGADTRAQGQATVSNPAREIQMSEAGSSPRCNQAGVLVVLRHRSAAKAYPRVVIVSRRSEDILVHLPVAGGPADNTPHAGRARVTLALRAGWLPQPPMVSRSRASASEGEPQGPNHDGHQVLHTVIAHEPFLGNG